MQRDGRQASHWWLFGLLYALIAASFAARAYFNTAGPLLADTDDAMRLTAVHDLLAGQPWWDHTQARLNTPFGAEIHWSKLVDLPIAGLILIFRPFLGAFAETAAAYVWPLTLLLVLLWTSVKLCERFAGPDSTLAAVALPALSLSAMAEFAPGRIDHHSIQIILMLAMLGTTITALERPRWAIATGLLASTALAIGIESLPILMALVLAFGLTWVFRPERADALRGFGLSFALGTLAHLAIAYPPSRWLDPACDVIGLTYAAAAVGVGGAFTLLSLLSLANRPAWVRLAVGVAGGGALSVALLLMFPQCLGGPYAAVDPWLVDRWIDRIGEAEPLWITFLADPVYPIAAALPPLVGLGAIAWRVAFGPKTDRGAWLIYGLLLLVAVLVMLLQIRASRMAGPLAAPACAWLIERARAKMLAKLSVGRALTLAAAWIGSAGLAIALIANAVILAFPEYDESLNDPSFAGRRLCLKPEAFAELAQRQPTRILTPIDLGSHTLAFTPHSVVAAPYHRNQQGVRDAFAFFNEPVDGARKILADRGVTLVVLCDQMPEVKGFADADPNSFAKLYAEGRLPVWLTPEPSAGPLKLFAVAPLTLSP